jgi:hypothetical protein
VHQVEHEGPPGHNACATRQEVTPYNCFKH